MIGHTGIMKVVSIGVILLSLLKTSVQIARCLKTQNKLNQERIYKLKRLFVKFKIGFNTIF